MTKDESINIIHELVSNGFYVTTIPHLESIVDIEAVTWVNDSAPNVKVPVESQALSSQLEAIDEYIKNKILTPLFKEPIVTGKIELWDGTEPTSCVWHNDLVEGWNMFALIYFNKMTESSGGGISFKTPTEDVYTVYPDVGTCVLVNMEPWYKHKVEPMNIEQQRVVLNICYQVIF